MEKTLENKRERERSEIRFRWLKELIERLRSERPHWPDEAIEAVYDNVKETLLRDPNFGRSRAAVWGAIKKQAGWVASDRKRLRKNQDGSRRDHPRAALSIDWVVARADGSELELADLIAGPQENQPEAIVERRLQVEAIRDEARRGGPNAERAVIGAMVGSKPAEIADLCGVKENTVHKWMERFRTLYRADEESIGGSARS